MLVENQQKCSCDIFSCFLHLWPATLNKQAEAINQKKMFRGSVKKEKGAKRKQSLSPGAMIIMNSKMNSVASGPAAAGKYKH